MREILKFGILFVLCSIVLSLLAGYITSIFDLFGASLNYVSTGNIGQVFGEIVGFVGWLLDLLFLGDTVVYTTYYGDITVYSLSWVLTVVRVIFGLSVLVIILKLIIDR